jgi:hypothetical protein
MRLLFAIPHFFDPDPAGGGGHGSLRPDPGRRLRALGDCLAAIQQLFGRPQCAIDIARRTTVPANLGTALAADVVVCTTGGRHLLDRLSLGQGYFAHRPTEAEPGLLGFECHAALRDRLADDYDYYCYLEDDLLIRDPWFFVKLRWFAARFGEEVVLMPNRYEVARGELVHKAYVDGPMRPRATAAFQDRAGPPQLEAETLGTPVKFRRTTNPHSGGFFLTARQMAEWVSRPYFLDRDVRFIGPLESAATLGVMRTFRVYKPVMQNAAFLELEHSGTAFLDRIKPPPTAPG